MDDRPFNLDVAALAEQLDAGDSAGAARAYEAADPGPDATRALFARLSVEDATRLLGSIADRAKSLEVLRWLPEEQIGAILAAMSPGDAAHLLVALPSDERADLIAAVEDDEQRRAIQAAFPDAAKADVARLLAYPPDTAGGLMETEFLALPAGDTVREAIRTLRAGQERYATIGVQYLYIVDGEGRLVGVVPVRDLLLGVEEATLGSLVKSAPATVNDRADMETLIEAFDEHAYMALPVVDERGVMLGVVSRADLFEAEHEEAEEAFRVSQGIVGGEELRSMPIVMRLRRRGAWLGVNLILCLGGAAVIGLYKDTLASAIVVAAVLPVVSATSGNAAMQAAAVSIRELTLGIIDPGAWRRVLVHELMMAGLMALPLGAAVGALAKLWGAGWGIGVAVAAAMAINALLAVGIGAVTPLVLRRLHVDPALASGPICTTVADVLGFALVLSMVAMAV